MLDEVVLTMVAGVQLTGSGGGGIQVRCEGSC